MKSLLKIQNISITRGTKEILHNLSWSVDQGQHWVMMGSNGCGKTTLIEIASGYLWPTEGEVFLFDGKLGEIYLPDERKKFGFVASWVLNRTESFIPVEHVIASGVDASIGFTKISKKLDQKIRAQLKFFDSSLLYGRKFGELSSGERLKVVLARALINNPKLLILDEPFSHLDMGVRFHLYTFLEKIAKNPQGPSIILVTHHMEDIRPFFTHALLLKNGCALAQGRLKTVLTNENLKKTFNIKQNVIIQSAATRKNKIF